MQGSELDEEDLFQAIAKSHVRALLIGRRAMVLLGIPVMTADYDFWLHFDDIELFNAALAPTDHFPSCTPDEARQRGRYVIENGEHIDVMVARAATTKEGELVRFEEVWDRHQTLRYANVPVSVPIVEDLIRTKAWSMRQKDIADIQLLRTFARQKGKPQP